MMDDIFFPDHVADFELRILAGGVLQYRKLWRESDPIDAFVSDTKAQRWTEWANVPVVTGIHAPNNQSDGLDQPQNLTTGSLRE